MRRAVMLALCLLAIPSVASSDCTELEAKSDISFGLPFTCGATEMGERNGADVSQDNCRGICLAEKFAPGLSVTLVGEKGICIAKTGDICSFNFPSGAEEVTQVVGTEDCLARLGAEELFKNERFRIAVVGIDCTAVRLESLENDSTLAKGIELNARRLVEPSKPSLDAHPATVLSDSPPRVLRFKNVTLLLFTSKEPAWPTAKGPPVMLYNNTVFRLQGWCTDGYVFFLVNDKLYLTYWNSCCACGWNCQLVYDLSGETPKLVYTNGVFSD
jgi:hypothetical protein